jgi:hypothetical protein
MNIGEWFKALASNLPARRGNLYEQYYERKDSDGNTRRLGPYYVWTRCEDGKMVSERVPKEDVPRVREEIANGKRLDDLIGKLWKMSETMARDAGGAKKNGCGQIDAAAALLIEQTLNIFEDAQSGTCDLAAAETRIRDASLGFAAKMVGDAMSGPLQRAAGVEQPPGRKEQRTCLILSAVGEVSYTRWYAVNERGEWHFPADDALGIVCGCTPGAAMRLCHMGAKSQSYAEASESLALLSGIQASPNSIHRLIGEVAPDMAKWADEREPARVPPEREVAVCLQMDMTGVRLLKKHLAGVKGKDGDPKTRQIKCGVVFLMEMGEDGKYAKVPDSSVHVLSFGDVAGFAAQLEKARQKLGVKFGAKLIVVSDGAEWIWNLVKDRFRQAFCVVDFWHAAEHLHELCEFVYGKTDAAAERFVELRHKLKHHGVDCIIRHFEALEAFAQMRKGIEKRLRYFRTHQSRMQYHLYRRKGWPIGSGEVEGACKSLIKQRTDLSGQRWTPHGALNVLWVRALVNDDLHQAYWESRVARHYKPTAA